MITDIKDSIIRLQKFKNNGSKDEKIALSKKDLKAIDVAIAALTAIDKLSNEVVEKKYV